MEAHLQDEEGNNAVTGKPSESNQTNYLSLDTTMTKSDDVFTCLVEVTNNEVAKFEVPLNTFSKYQNWGDFRHRSFFNLHFGHMSTVGVFLTAGRRTSIQFTFLPVMKLLI